MVGTDEDTTAAALRTCFEPGEGGSVTVRLADNRTFTQRLRMTQGGQTWAWTWPGKQDYGATGSVIDAARAVFDTPTSYLLPPLSTTAVGIGRPAAPGATFIAATASVDAETVLVDVMSFAFDQLSIGGTGNPLADAFLQASFECGGKQLLASRSTAATALVQGAVSAVVGCAGEIADPHSEFGARFQQLALRTIRAHPQSADTVAKAYRTIDEAGKAFKLLTVGQVAFYTSDQLANAAVGPLTLSLQGYGTPPTLGRWTASCTDLRADTNALYKNLALQDEYTEDTSRELSRFADWSANASIAVGPLRSCSAGYRGQLATALLSSWEDVAAARVVASYLVDQAPPPSVAPPLPPTPSTPAPSGHTIGAAFDDTCVINWPTAPTYTSDSVQMIMGCEHVDEGQFFYTEVVYPDTSFRPTPSTGRMHVVGRVVDIATSAYGYRVLVVQASSITIPVPS